MLFNSFAFLLFFPLVVAVHFMVPARWRWVHQLVVSYAFYMWWEPAYALLILASTVVDWGVAKRLVQTRGRARAALLAVSLAVNLGLLFSFKYYDFANAQLALVLEAFGYGWTPHASSLLLPVGISFYTFQTLGYTIDVYRGKQAPEPNLARFALYVCFWPQLVAGPIERAGRLLPQLQMFAEWDSERVVSGLRRMLWGLFKKMVIADRIAPVVGAVYADPEPSGWAFVLAVVMFSYQIWCDFSGYTDVALGAAKVLGVDLVENFHQPHLATSVRDYWRRWHVSLSQWFRDYLYIPLGGNRVGPARHTLNVIFVMSLCGLWHGAGWNFVLWGLLHGIFIVIEVRTQALRDAVAARLRIQPTVRAMVQRPLAFGLVGVTYSAFRSDGAAHWWSLLQRLPKGWDTFQPAGFAAFAEEASHGPLWLAVLLLALPATELLQYARRDARITAWWWRLPFGVRVWGDVALLFAVVGLGEMGAQAFIYFQF